LIPGQQGDKFMAGVHYIFHSRIHQEKRGQELMPPVFEMRTAKWNGYIAGNRLGELAANLPDPMIGNYETLITQLGFDAVKIRESLPSVATADAAVSAARTAARPPVLAVVVPATAPVAAAPQAQAPRPPTPAVVRRPAPPVRPAPARPAPPSAKS
jgi:hypothetical protein